MQTIATIYRKKLKLIMKIKCPNCGKETFMENNPWRPFCSKNCKILDLWNWINEVYCIEELCSSKSEEKKETKYFGD